VTESSSTQPNIILIFSDQHRHDWTGCADCGLVDTPNLDALSRRGTRFSAASCNAPLCGPSRMSMLTGRQPFRNRVYINEDCLDPNAPTMAHALGLAGYETVLCGRMHFMGPDHRHGFQKRLVGDICRSFPGSQMTDYGQRAGSAGNIPKAIQHAGPGDSPVLRYDEDVTRAFERFVSDRSPDSPLFATVGWYGPHHPFVAPPELYELARERMQGDVPISDELTHPWLADLKRHEKVPDLTPERVAMVRTNYAGMIDLMDRRIGRVLDAARSLPGETVIVYASDHGEMACDHGLLGKGCFFEASVGVPLIFAPLGESSTDTGIAPGNVVDAPVSLVDLAPTLCAMGGAKELPFVDGQDLSPLMVSDSEPGRAWTDRAIFSELAILFADRTPMRMIRRGNHKLAYYHRYESPMLFDLAADPHEQTDLAGRPEYRELQQQLMADLLDGWNPDAVERDGREHLRDLQYIQRWDRQVGVPGRYELWDPERPVYEFALNGQPISYLDD
jgi:choline-sulfatase